MKTIFEIKADAILLKTFYHFCRINNIGHFKSIDNKYYYAKIENEKNYVALSNYLLKKSIKYKNYILLEVI